MRIFAFTMAQISYLGEKFHISDKSSHKKQEQSTKHKRINKMLFLCFADCSCCVIKNALSYNSSAISPSLISPLFRINSEIPKEITAGRTNCMMTILKITVAASDPSIIV